MYEYVLIHAIITSSCYHSTLEKKTVIAVTTYRYQSSKGNASRDLCQSSVNTHAHTRR